LEPVSWEVERAARREAEADAERVGRLQAATAALSGTRTPDQVAEVALGAGLEALGGVRGFLLVEGTRGRLTVLRGHGTGDEEVRLAASSDVPNPAAECYRTAAPVFVEDRAALLARYPALAGLDGAVRGEALAALPLALDGRALGVLAVGFDAPRRFGDAERAIAIALAGQCAQALERARLFAAERLARAEVDAVRGRLALLDALSALLAESTDEEEMLAGLARLAVPVLGDWAGVFLATEAGGFDLAARAGPAALGRSVEAHLRADAQGRLARTSRCGEPLVMADFPAGPEGGGSTALLAPLCLMRRSLGSFVVARSSAAAGYGPADVTLVADIAHRSALAVEHARLLREATVAAAAREEFLHVASHELRGPLGTLRLTVHLLRRDVRKGDRSEIEARLRVLDRQAQRLVRLSDALLDVSRITAGRVELAREQGDLAALVRDVASAFEEEAAEVDAPLTVEAAEPVRCTFDAGRVEQVVSNLLSNALKYGRGQPIRIAVRALGDRARIEVEDHGLGIPVEDQERIFGRFERAVSGRHYAGLGLGLWIARRLVDAHGGSIQVKSAPGLGSTFTVDLPLGSPGAQGP
jgi:signal transduction histidine kinase